MKKLENKVAYITGGASGLGAEIMNRQKTWSAEALMWDEDRTRRPRHPETTSAQGRTGEPQEYRNPVDDTLDSSFPASDPPSWTLGLA